MHSDSWNGKTTGGRDMVGVAAWIGSNCICRGRRFLSCRRRRSPSERTVSDEPWGLRSGAHADGQCSSTTDLAIGA